MTDRELVDALRSTTSRSKRKLLDAAADRIESALRQQFVVISLLNDISILHDQDQISVPDRGQTMGDCNGCTG